jgi:hypothetical protein
MNGEVWRGDNADVYDRWFLNETSADCLGCFEGGVRISVVYWCPAFTDFYQITTIYGRKIIYDHK